MSGRNGEGPYLDLDRDTWRGLRASTPISLTASELDEVRGLGDPIQLSEVEEIYLPLSRLLRLYFEASAGLRETVGAFVGEEMGPAPFIIAVAGSVAVGKSTVSRVLRTLISQWPQRPRTELVTTDNFLYSTAELQRRGAGERQHVRRPAVLILEGINVLQPAPAGVLTLADFFDFSVYVDAHPEHIRQWYLDRLHKLRETAFTDPRSPFHQLAKASDAEVDTFGRNIWATINEVNLVENIQPTRARASLVLHKGADHSVTRVRLRRF
jgi:type I pantothenate kinase